MNRHRLLICIFAVLAAAWHTPALAQLSEYQENYQKHHLKVRRFLEYFNDLSSSSPGEIEELRISLGILYAMQHDDITLPFEADAEREFNTFIRIKLIDRYPGIEEQLKRTIKIIATGSDLRNRTVPESRKTFEFGRLKGLIENGTFALPILLYKQKTPYHDMYRMCKAAYDEHIKGPGGPNPFDIQFYRPENHDFGSTEIMTMAKKNARKAAEKEDKDAAFATAREARLAANAEQTSQQVDAFRAQVEAEAQRLRQDQDMLTNRIGYSSQNGVFSWLLLIVVIMAGLWFFKSKLPKPIQQTIEQVENSVRKLFGLARRRIQEKSK